MLFTRSQLLDRSSANMPAPHFKQEWDTEDAVVLILQSNSQVQRGGVLHHCDLKAFSFSTHSLVPREFLQNKYCISILMKMNKM